MQANPPEWIIHSGSLQAESTGRHAHEHHQLLLATKGLMLFEDAQKRHVLCGQNAVFIPGGCMHTAETIGDVVHFASLYFTSDFFEQRATHSPTSLPDAIVVFQISPLFLMLMEDICGHQDPGELGEPVSTTIRLLLLRFLQEKEHILPVSLPLTPEPRLAKMLTFIDENYHKDLCLEDLERAFHCSKRTVQRLFKKELYTSFSGYLRLRRIFEATILLTTTAIPILEVAFRVGYDSLSAFYHAFTTLVGDTPRKYRLTS